MQSFFKWLDRIADIKTEPPVAKWLERIAFFFLLLMILFAPHSIAATQTAWLTGMTAWVVGLFFKPRQKLQRTLLDVPLWTFFGWTVLSSVCSYAPDISIDKLRNATLFLIFYFIINVVRTKRAVIFLAFALVLSCLGNVAWTSIERIIGRGVEISGVKADSPLAKALLIDGDALLEINKRKIRTPADLIAEIEKTDAAVARVKFYRPDFYFEVDLKRVDLLDGTSTLERLGIGNWKPSRNWRSTGFYGHYVTYAEVLQLLASLVFGLLVASISKAPQRRGGGGGNEETEESQIANCELRKAKEKKRQFSLVFAGCLGGILFALLLTSTRASQAAFLVSAFAMVFVAGNRKMLLLLAAVILPLTLGGLVFLQQSRMVSFYDTSDDSIVWRQTIYREGFNLATANARHVFLGVGMDSIKRYAKDWHLFDDGRLPMGHFHSTPLQLFVERGLPAVLLWLWVLWIYARLLWQNLKARIKNPEAFNWHETGIVLGSFGGLIGFFTSGLVHYNYGDAVVAMMFFILMGLSVKIVLNGEW